MYTQKGTGRARHGSARVNLFRGGGRSFGPRRAQPRDRSAEEGACARTAACALVQGEGRRHHRDRRDRSSRKPRPRRSSQHSGSSVSPTRSSSTAREIEKNFGRAARNIPQHRRAAGRRASTSTTSCAAQKLVLTKAARRSAGGALQMSNSQTDPRHYDVIRRPVDHRKGDDGVRAQPGRVQASRAPRPSRRSRKRSRSCSTSR